MMMRLSLVRKCSLKSKTEVYIQYHRVWSDQETGSRNEAGGATSNEAAPEYFGAKWRLLVVKKKDRWILKYLAWYYLFIRFCNIDKKIHFKTFRNYFFLTLWCKLPLRANTIALDLYSQNISQTCYNYFLVGL